MHMAPARGLLALSAPLCKMCKFERGKNNKICKMRMKTCTFEMCQKEKQCKRRDLLETTKITCERVKKTKYEVSEGWAHCAHGWVGGGGNEWALESPRQRGGGVPCGSWGAMGPHPHPLPRHHVQPSACAFGT